MSQGLKSPAETYTDRRSNAPGEHSASGERRQFTNSHEELSPEARELATSIDQYKIRHRRRFITYEEMLVVMQSLGYHK
jgi:hypothetical protein